MNIRTVNHTTIDGTEALDVVMADEAKDIVGDLELDIKFLEDDNKKLKQALQDCFDVIRGALR
jgi:uncharacterized protein related to proFAR isomerase